MPSGVYERTKYHIKRLKDSHLGKPSGALGKSWKQPQKVLFQKCKCGCGKELNIYDKKNRIRYYILGHNTPKKENNYLWKGGITPLNQQIYHSSNYTFWRKSVFKRDNYTCQKCGRVGGELESHHKKEFCKIISENSITTLKQALDCEELWKLDNGITLCKNPCHFSMKKFHGNRYTNLIKQTLKL